MYVPFGKPLLSVKYAVLKQLVAPPEVTCPIDLPFIETVTLPPQTVIPCEVTWIAKFISVPCSKVGSGGLFKPVAVIDVGLFPETVGDVVGDAVGDAVAVGDALALGDGVALEAADELDVVVDDAVVDELLVLTTCGLGLGEVEEVHPATKIVAITAATTTSKERRLFLMFFAQIALHAAHI